MKIEDLSITELKAAYDFVLIDLKDLEAAAKDKGLSVDRIPAYREVKDIENRLYHKLLNITRDLE
ncbi:hypothetical protein BC749_10967 [Flavobacterium araucananum]|uniref:Uncharacterized protein n=1 Tax=Flavobacterium araucananum TaxID=946678 RepID=A0A227P7C9_9FLAO|nr:hypothetical protein [Flavobacterium araucananum]OXG05076.1 hypothetical protein B0A64_13675 [Flavobacterium araucananum]PWJ96790.1 hypothetical protein BC749_10967 [Flavobacterium araucananum]